MAIDLVGDVRSYYVLLAILIVYTTDLVDAIWFKTELPYFFTLD